MGSEQSLAVLPGGSDNSGLAFFDAARYALEQAATVDEVKQIRDQAEALRQYSRQARQSLEMQNRCAEIKLRAERRAGEMLVAMPRQERGRPSEKTLQHETISLPPTLADLGVTPIQSHRWQQVAAIPEPVFEAYIEGAQDEEVELTTAGLLRVGAEPTEPEPIEGEVVRHAVHYSSESGEWYTPVHILESVTEVLGSIDLDPCADPGRLVPAAHHYTAADDGLFQEWRGRVYMNPPYGRAIEPWINRWVEHVRSGDEAVALVPARTDTEWWDRLTGSDVAVCFINGRLRFSGSENSAPFPSAVVYHGDNLVGFHRAFRAHGRVWMVFDPEDADT